MRRFPTMVVLTSLLACSSATRNPGQSGAHSDSRTITADELSTANQLTLYDYVKASRPRWLVSIGGDRSFPIAVYVNDSQLGPAETLKTMGLDGIRLVRYFDASAAQAHFNRVSIGPVIQVVTH